MHETGQHDDMRDSKIWHPLITEPPHISSHARESDLSDHALGLLDLNTLRDTEATNLNQQPVT